MKLIYLKSALKYDSFDVAIDIKIQFFRVLVTIEPDRSLLQFVTTNCLISILMISNCLPIVVKLIKQTQLINNREIFFFQDSGIQFSEYFGPMSKVRLQHSTRKIYYYYY